jgi:hypothetical protein
LADSAPPPNLKIPCRTGSKDYVTPDDRRRCRNQSPLPTPKCVRGTR